MENATSLAVSIKKHKIYITLGEQHDAFCHELTQINLLIRYHNWQLCANKNKGKNSIHTYDLKILLISGCRLQNSSGLRFLEMILIKTLSCRVRTSRRVFINLWTYSEFFPYLQYKDAKKSWKCQNCCETKMIQPFNSLWRDVSVYSGKMKLFHATYF